MLIPAPDFRKPLIYKDLRRKKVQNKFRKNPDFDFRWTPSKCEKVSPSAFYLAFYRMKKTFPQCERFDVSDCDI